MNDSTPLAFGDDGVEVPAATATPRKRSAEPAVQLAARRVLAILEPLEPEARGRVVRATAILLGLELP